MNEFRGEDGTGRSDGVSMRHRTAFDIDDVLRQPQLARGHHRDDGEGLVDFGPFDEINVPARARQRLLDGRDWAKAEHARLYGRNPIRDKAGYRNQPPLFRPCLIGKHHGAGGVVQTRRVARGNGSIRPEGGLQPRERFERRVRPVMLILVEGDGAFLAWHFDGHDLCLKMPAA